MKNFKKIYDDELHQSFENELLESIFSSRTSRMFVYEICKKVAEGEYSRGFDDGASKQAILELQGRDRFLGGLEGRTP